MRAKANQPNPQQPTRSHQEAHDIGQPDKRRDSKHHGQGMDETSRGPGNGPLRRRQRRGGCSRKRDRSARGDQQQNGHRGGKNEPSLCVSCHPAEGLAGHHPLKEPVLCREGVGKGVGGLKRVVKARECQKLLKLLAGRFGGHCLAELRQPRRRNARWHPQPAPAGHRPIKSLLTERGDLRGGGQPLGRHHPQASHPLRRTQGIGLRHRAADKVEAACDQLLKRRARSVERHPGDRVGRQPAAVEPASDSGMPNPSLRRAARLQRRVGLADGSLKRCERFVGSIPSHKHRRRISVEQTERREILVGDRGQPSPVEHRELHRHHHQRGAVGPAAGPAGQPCHARATRRVDHVDRHAEPPLKLHRHLPRHAVRAASRRPRADQGDRP